MSLEVGELKGRLWGCANVLRGSAVDRGDWKGFILPLLFFKRICDVWDEEEAETVEAFGPGGAARFAETHRFTVPEGCHWRDVRNRAKGVGRAIRRAMREIEREM